MKTPPKPTASNRFVSTNSPRNNNRATKMTHQTHCLKLLRQRQLCKKQQLRKDDNNNKNYPKIRCLKPLCQHQLPKKQQSHKDDK